MSSSAIKAGEAYVEISARDQQFAQALEANRARMQGFVGQLQEMATQFALAEIKESISLFNDFGDALNKMSFRTGFSAQALSELDFAAARSGASIADVEKAITGMNRFLIQAERALEKAAEKGQSFTAAMEAADAGPVIDTLKALAINTEQFFAADPESRFMMLAGALGDIEDPGRRAGLGMQVFGRSATQLMPLIAEGADGMARLRERARELGKTMDDDAAGAAASWVDANEDLSRAIDGLLLQMAGQLAPTITFLTDAMATLIAEHGDAIITFGSMAGAVIAVGGALKIVNSILAVYASRAAIAQALSGPAGWATLAISLGAVAVAAHEVDEALRGTSTVAVDKATASVRDLKRAVDDLNQDAAADKVDAVNDALRRNSEGFRRREADLRNNTEAIKGMLAAQATEAEKLAEQLSVLDARARLQRRLDLGGGRDDGAFDADQIEAIRDKLIDRATGFGDEMKKITREVELLNGTLTETEAKLADMAENGLPTDKVEALRQAFADLQVAQEQAEAQRIAEQQDQQRFDDMSRQAEQIREALKTPADRLEDLRQETEALVAAKLLERREAEKFLADRAAAAQTDVVQRDDGLQQSVTAQSSADLRSAEGAKLLASLLNGTQSIDAKIAQATAATAKNTGKLAAAERPPQAKV